MRTGNTQPTGAQQLAALKAKQQQLLGAIKEAQEVAEEPSVPKGPQHGTVSMYNNHGCRCDDCRAASSAYMMQYRLSKGYKPRPEAAHGTVARYNNHGCRCDACKRAMRAYSAEHRVRVPNDNHGLANYNRGCRCDECKLAKSEYSKKRAAQKKADRLTWKHGTEYTYTAKKCRCDECTRVASEARRKRKAATPPSAFVPPSAHGTVNGYDHYGCRCAECKRAKAAYKRAARGGARELSKRAQHGTQYRYRTWGCRCTDCTRANTEAVRNYRQRKLAKLDTQSKSEDD